MIKQSNQSRNIGIPTKSRQGTYKVICLKWLNSVWFAVGASWPLQHDNHGSLRVTKVKFGIFTTLYFH